MPEDFAFGALCDEAGEDDYFCFGEGEGRFGVDFGDGGEEEAVGYVFGHPF